MQWMGQQAVVTLPQDIDNFNANQIREQLLWIINRGAAVLIADLARTVSCDYSGVEVLARAHHRAVANGTELRLVVTADVVRRALSLNGLDRLVAVYPDLDAAIAAGSGRREHRTQTADPAAQTEELLGLTVQSIFGVGLILQAAIDLPPDDTAQCITDALRRLDDVVQDIRDHVLAEGGHSVEPGLVRRSPPQILQRSAQARDRAQLLRLQVTQMAHAMQSAAAGTAALLERRADLLGQPGSIDYPTEIKKWRALADQARQMAERWEQPP